MSRSQPEPDERKHPLLQGASLTKGSQRTHEMIERLLPSPTTVHGDPVPPTFWRLVYEELGRERRKAKPPLDSTFVPGERWAYHLWKNKVKAMSPSDALIELHIMQRMKKMDREIASLAQEAFRVACYRVLHNEFLGRSVG